MPAKSSHHKTKNQKYTIVFFPSSESKTPRSITVDKMGLIGLCVGSFTVIALIVMGMLAFTPLGMYVPISNPELENRYHKQVVAIQERLTQLTEDVVSLREYNLRLRRALGESISPYDSAFIASQLRMPRTDRRIDNERPRNGRDAAQQLNESPLTQLIENRGPSSAQPAAFVVKAVQTELPLTLPVRGYVSQEFNPDQQHFGIDVAGKEGSPIGAASDGSVIFSGWTYDDGYMIMLSHGSGYRTTYKHNQALLKAPGAFVRRGEPIALLGNSGITSYGPHLHFEVWKDGVPHNPKEFLLHFE